MTTEQLNAPVGTLAEKDFTALDQDLTVTGALAQIRERGAAQQIIYFYVVDAQQRLVGVLPTRRLLLAAPDARLRDLMVSRVVTIPETATVLEACEMFLMHKFLAFPVVTPDRLLVGVINVGMFSQFTEEALGLSEREHLEEIFERIGFRVAEVQSASPVKAFRLRLPWLAATLAGGIGCALIAGFFETTLAAKIILAFFLTLCARLERERQRAISHGDGGNVARTHAEPRVVPARRAQGSVVGIDARRHVRIGGCRRGVVVAGTAGGGAGHRRQHRAGHGGGVSGRSDGAGGVASLQARSQNRRRPGEPGHRGCLHAADLSELGGTNAVKIDDFRLTIYDW